MPVRFFRLSGITRSFLPAFAACLFATFASAQQPISVTINEYPVPFPGISGGAGAIAVGSDNALWFWQDKLGVPNISVLWRITTSGTTSSYQGPGLGGFQSLTPGPDDALWYASGNNIGRVTTSGAFSSYPLASIPMPFYQSYGIVAGPDGALWFTAWIGRSLGTAPSSSIGRITTAGAITLYDLPDPTSAPNGIAVGSDGALWFTETGKIGRITTSGTITEYPVTVPSSYALEWIAAGPDGALWFTESSIGGNPIIGRITTAGALTEYSVPWGDSGAEEYITAGPDGAVWFTAGANIGRITSNGIISEYPVPSGNTAGGITLGPDGNLWFTDASANVLNVGQLVLSTPTLPPTLSITSQHTGNFTTGQINATYTLTVSNQSGGAPSTGAVTVTDTLPSGLSLISMSGTGPNSGWTCTGNSCARSDALLGGAVYPSITVNVAVAPNATSPQVNQATVSGGGSASANASDSTTIVPEASFFTGEISVGNGIYYLTFPDATLFGYYGYLAGGWMYHVDMGYEWVDPSNDANGDVLLL